MVSETHRISDSAKDKHLIFIYFVIARALDF